MSDRPTVAGTKTNYSENITFNKSPVTGNIEIHDEKKCREYCFYDIKDYLKFSQKVDKKEHLRFFASSTYQGSKGFIATLKSDRIKVKNKNPYNIEGKYLEFDYDDRGAPRLKEIKLSRNDSFYLPDYDSLNNKLFSFIKNKKFYNDNNLFYRLGILLYGFPGNGKTSWLRYLLNNSLLPKDATVIWCKELPENGYVQAFKKIKGLKVFIFEEITSMTSNPTAIREFLQFMDGEQTVDNSVYIATTNHPEHLPQNIIERPGRFDLIFELDNPKGETLTTILKHYFKDKFEESMMLDATGLSHAEIKEAYISSVLNTITFKDAVEKAKKHKDFVKRGFEKFGKIGFYD